jgi:hypothetical protein
VIFIDKFNVSGIEMMISDWRVQEIASWAGNLLAKWRRRKTILTFVVEGGPRLESFRKRVDPF